MLSWKELGLETSTKRAKVGDGGFSLEQGLLGRLQGIRWLVGAGVSFRLGQQCELKAGSDLVCLEAFIEVPRNAGHGQGLQEPVNRAARAF